MFKAELFPIKMKAIEVDDEIRILYEHMKTLGQFKIVMTGG